MLGSLNVARLMVRLGRWQVAQPIGANWAVPRLMASFSARGSDGISPSRASSWRVVGPRLGRDVDRQGGLVAHPQLVDHAVEVAVPVLAGQLHRLHPDLLVGRRPG